MVYLLRKNASFFIPYFLFVLCGASLFINYDKAQLHLLFNNYHSTSADRFFYYATYLGDGFTALGIGIALFFIKYRWALLFALSNISAAAITQLLKHTYFNDYVRPANYFTDSTVLNFVPGVEQLYHNTFPSGHSTCAFASYLCLAAFSDNELIKFLFFLIALSAGISRIYLNQHFFNDVYAGSIIAVTCCLLFLKFFENKNSVKLEKSLLNR